MKAPVEGAPLYEYTMMPTHMTQRFGVEELQDVQLAEPFSFTKGCRTMKIPAREEMNNPINFGSKLFHLTEDPKEEHELDDIKKETELANAMIQLMKDNDSSADRLARFGYPAEGNVTSEDMLRLRRGEFEDRIPKNLADCKWEKGAVNMYHVFARFTPPSVMETVNEKLQEAGAQGEITIATMMEFIGSVIPPENQAMVYYFSLMASRTI